MGSTKSRKWVTIEESDSVHQVTIVDESAVINIVNTVILASYQNVSTVEDDTIAEDSVAVVDSMVDWIAVQQGRSINNATIEDITTVSATASFIGDSIYDDAMTIIGKSARNIYSKTMSLMGQDSTNARTMDVLVSAVVVAV